MYQIIVACDPRGVMGDSKTNGLPWHVPEDLKLFKQRTLGKTVIMGKNTWASLPKKPLPQRTNVVLSRNPVSPLPNYWFKSFDELLSVFKSGFIIGGKQIYEKALDLGVVSEIIITKMKKEYEGDIYFPEVKDWKVSDRQDKGDFEIMVLSK